jgi:hypothetical protein
VVDVREFSLGLEPLDLVEAILDLLIRLLDLV